MEIRIYNQEMALLGIIENQTSLIWLRKYYTCGEFELHAPITPDNLRMLRKENLIFKRGSTEAGIIEDLTYDEEIVTTEIVAKGRFLSAYMDRRLIKSTVTIRDTAERAMRTLLSRAVAIPRVELGALAGYTQRVDFQATYKNLLEYESKIARAAGLGFRFRPDFSAKKIIFEVYAGIDRSASQGINSRVIFSEAYNNLNHSTYRYNSQLYYNVAYVGGEGEGSARKYVQVGNASGLALREMFVDAKDIRQEEGVSDAAYLELLRQRGLERLAQNVEMESFAADTGADINFIYRQDYDLGDIVTVKKQGWNITQDFRITELKEVYEFGGMKVEPTFGDPLPEKIIWKDE